MWETGDQIYGTHKRGSKENMNLCLYEKKGMLKIFGLLIVLSRCHEKKEIKGNERS